VNNDALAAKYASHGAVVVEMVVAEIGEDGGIEEDAVHPPLGEGVGTTPPWPPQVAPDRRASSRIFWTTGASGVVRNTVERADDCARRTVFIEDRRPADG